MSLLGQNLYSPLPNAPSWLWSRRSLRLPGRQNPVRFSLQTTPIMPSVEELLYQLCSGSFGNNTQNCARANFEISSPEKFGAPLNFAFALWPMGRKISNWLYLSFWMLFLADIFRHTRLEVWKIILTFSILENVFNSIFLRFCMSNGDFNISGSLEASALKFAHTMNRWCTISEKILAMHLQILELFKCKHRWL